MLHEWTVQATSTSSSPVGLDKYTASEKLTGFASAILKQIEQMDQMSLTS